MDLQKLPSELILKIFSYVPQRSRLALTQVSVRMKQIALDPAIWTEVIIDSTLSTCPELLSEVLNHATLMRKLDASGDDIDLEALATASTLFERLEELTIMGRMLLHPATARLLCNCRHLSSIVLRGKSLLTTKTVIVLQEVPGLKSLLLSPYLRVPEQVFEQLCVSCLALEKLELCSTYIGNDDTWNFLGRLRNLKSLSVTALSTNGLFHITSSCPNLEVLEINVIWNKNRVSAAQALEGSRKLRVLKVRHFCAQGWFLPGFCTPPSLEYFHVPELSMDKRQLKMLTDNCRALRKVTLDVCRVEGSALVALSVCTNLENISLSGLRGDNLILKSLSQFPKLAYANLDIVQAAPDVFEQLQSIVDLLKTNPKSRTRLAISIFPPPYDPADPLARELAEFKNFLAAKTGQSTKHARGVEERLLRPPNLFSTLDISVATTSETLKSLVLNLHHF